MKKYSIIFSFILLLAVASSASALPSYDDSHLLTSTGYTSSYSSIVETFEGTPLVSGTTPVQGWTIVGTNYAIRQGNTTEAASPWYDADPGPVTIGKRDVTKYLTVPLTLTNPPETRSIDILFKGVAQNYLGLWWGSMDDYNKLEFLDVNGNVIASETVTGLAFSAGTGAQDSPDTNMYRNFYGMHDFYGIRITSTNFAFELDNLAVGHNVVPEPTTMLLLGLGLVGLAGAGRKFTK